MSRKTKEQREAEDREREEQEASRQHNAESDAAGFSDEELNQMDEEAEQGERGEEGDGPAAGEEVRDEAFPSDTLRNVYGDVVDPVPFFEDGSPDPNHYQDLDEGDERAQGFLANPAAGGRYPAASDDPLNPANQNGTQTAEEAAQVWRRSEK